jgi:hypothetical protein
MTLRLLRLAFIRICSLLALFARSASAKTQAAAGLGGPGSCWAWDPVVAVCVGLRLGAVRAGRPRDGG